MPPKGFVTITVKETTYDRLAKLASKLHKTIPQFLSELVEAKEAS